MNHFNAQFSVSESKNFFTGLVFGFDVGTGSIGGAARPETQLLHKASLLIPAGFVEKKKGAAKAPYGSHRSCLAAEAARLFSQPIVAARLVLIRPFDNPKQTISSTL